MKNDPNIVPSEIKLAALALLSTAGVRPEDGAEEVRFRRDDGRVEVFNPAQDFLHDFLTEKDFEASAVTTAAFAALDGKLPVLLSEAFSVYLDNHSKGQDKKFKESQLQHWNKVINLLGDKPIKAVTREDARRYRDHRLASGVSATTVAREINAIKAVFSKAIRELSLAIPNQFASIEIPNSGRNAHDRLPYTPEELNLLINEAAKVNDEQRRIVVVLALTGARLAEIVGLRKQDLDIARQSIHIKPHSGRSLKTGQSEREIPLLPLAFEALSTQASEIKGDFLFPSYASKERTNADSASATLNKWARKFVPERSMHCFRHALRDRLRAVMCPESISKEIGGWSSSHDVSVQYGQGYPVQLKREWLEKAYSSIRT
jgi:integrase